MIIEHCRDIKELKRLYKNRPMPTQYDFDWLIHNPNLFCFYEETNEAVKGGKLKGYITVQREGGLLTLSGASVRKNMKDNIDAIVCVCNVFKEDMYAFTPLKEAALVLKKAGFKKVDNEKYVRLKNDGKI